MSNKSIIITEKQIVDAMDEMCSESLDPELHTAWEQIVTNLILVRSRLANYPYETFLDDTKEEVEYYSCLP